MIALWLLGELTRQGHRPCTRPARRRSPDPAKGGRAPGAEGRELFRYFNQFIDVEQNGLDVLVYDEAHRITRDVHQPLHPASTRTGRPQVEELIDARPRAGVSPGRAPSRPTGRAGPRQGHRVRRGADGMRGRRDRSERAVPLRRRRIYETWVLRLLGLERGRRGVGRVTTTSQLTAGQALPSWSRCSGGSRTGATSRGSQLATAGRGANPRPTTSSTTSKIGGWQRPWNNRSDTSHGDGTRPAVLGHRAGGFDQVGCVYTAQGFEYDFGGVILGPDLVWRRDRWDATPSAAATTGSARRPRGVRQGGAQHLQGAADSRDAGRVLYLHGRGDAGAASNVDRVRNFGPRLLPADPARQNRQAHPQVRR